MSVEFQDNIGQQNARWQQMNQSRQRGGLIGLVMKMLNVDEKTANIILVIIFVAVLGVTAYFIHTATTTVRPTITTTSTSR